MHTPHRDSLIDSNDPQYSRWYYTFETPKAIRRLLWLDYVPWCLDPTLLSSSVTKEDQVRVWDDFHNLLGVFCGPRDFVVGTSYSTDQSYPNGPTSQSITWNRALKPIEWKQHPGSALSEPCCQPVFTSPLAYCREALLSHPFSNP